MVRIGRLRRHHHGAERARIGIEGEGVAERALARHPQPVRQDDIGGAAFQRDLAGLGAGQFGGLEIETGLLIEAVGFDDLKLPRQRAGFLHRDPDAIGGVRIGGGDRKRNRQDQEQAAKSFQAVRSKFRPRTLRGRLGPRA